MGYEEKVYEKLSGEFSAFREKLKQMPSEEVLLHSYEYIFKDEIALFFVGDSMNLTSRQAKALLSEKFPLDYLYQKWLKADSSYLDALRDSISDGIDSLVKEHTKKSRGAR